MERHHLDPISFVFGLLFVGIALIGLLDGVMLGIADLRWLLPGITIVLGLVLVVSAATGGRSRDQDDRDDISDTMVRDDSADDMSDTMVRDQSADDRSGDGR